MVPLMSEAVVRTAKAYMLDLLPHCIENSSSRDTCTTRASYHVAPGVASVVSWCDRLPLCAPPSVSAVAPVGAPSSTNVRPTGRWSCTARYTYIGRSARPHTPTFCFNCDTTVTPNQVDPTDALCAMFCQHCPCVCRLLLRPSSVHIIQSISIVSNRDADTN